MSAAVRVRKRPPVAFVPLERNKVVVVPTDDLPEDTPGPEAFDSPRNQEVLYERAEQLASPSSGTPKSPLSKSFLRPAPTKRSRSRTIDIPTVRPTFEAPTRTVTSMSDGNRAGTSIDTQTRKRTSWFAEHVMQPKRRQTIDEVAEQQTFLSPQEIQRPSMSSDRFSAASSIPQVDVIIPDEARSHLGRALAQREQHGVDESLPESVLHHNDIVEHLDVIDQHISTVSHLSNAANSILVPPLSFYSRKPTISIPARLVDPEKAGSQDELDLHVEDVLRKRDKLRRTLEGLWAYLKTPIGIVTALYGFAVVFWGAAIVLFLGKLINLHNPYLQGFWVEISSQVVNALFTVQGVGFLPWRIMDTYNILWIYYFYRLDRRLRSEAKFPPVGDRNDIPDPLIDSEHVQMLTDKQLERLRHYQVRFMKSQTWYRPHGTDTHRAFSINYALAICLFVDGNSVFQIILCGCMWGLDRFQRPPWTTGSLIPLSFLCGIAAAVLIWKGGERSKKTEEVEARLRAALDEEKRVLKDRYGPEVAEEPTLLNSPPEDPEIEKPPQEKVDLTPRKPAPHLGHFRIDETMSIPEDVEPTK
ncbi:SubName: Full=Related to ahmp1 protein {ECO:0000313/EMBL:CCA69063.1} [Serendipita indica DSM 11827]|uniref:Related to ahmp1 protein n=1 Tax=Serendipita indica (strain DSM 11827) TaxID=1109443 RepID=G4TCN4_SERID|nr:SubName: Full=Related to ahmp1 protein {ECO:0000313/EMBL:CCA69063.1} [Serendipita indica DSM 11827]CCA69063.1 related to ahmp1 protein [Serendipita indica DSM 11827]